MIFQWMDFLMAFHNVKCFLDLVPLSGRKCPENSCRIFLDVISARFLIFFFSENVAPARAWNWNWNSQETSEQEFLFNKTIGLHNKKVPLHLWSLRNFSKQLFYRTLGQVLLRKLYTFVAIFSLWLTNLPDIYNFQVMHTKIRKSTYMI